MVNSIVQYVGKLRGPLGVLCVKLYVQYTCFLYIENEFKLKREIDLFFFFGTDKNISNFSEAMRNR